MNKLCVPVSGGESSAYMAIRLRDELSGNVDMIFPYANTGWENEETLEFISLLESKYDIPVVWLEAVVYQNERKASGHKIVDFKSACRDGSVFLDVCKKYGLPNSNFLHCTRELKENPILSYCESIGWGKPPSFLRAIGIRSDEMDRVSPNYKLNGLYYPMAFDWMITKQHVNKFWQSKPERLKLESWRGNCKGCYKKSHRKHARIIKDEPEVYDFTKKLEKECAHIKPAGGQEFRKMFRSPAGANNKSGLTTDELFQYCKTLTPWSRDENQEYEIQNDMFCGSDCAPFQN